jgi:drug/metabolite transporter (DMT)-like permease
MSRKGLLLFIAAGVAWGLPYFFIRIAVEDFSTPTIIFARVVVGAAVLLPLAIRRNAIRPALKAWPWVLAFALIEMVGPWWLITEAERSITSGLAGLLVATVPFFAILLALVWLKDRSVLHPKTILGLVIGFAGVVLLVGIDSFAGHIDPVAVLMMIGASIGYAIAPMMVSQKAGEVPTIGVISLSMVIVSIVYAPFALANLPAEIAAGPSTESWISLVVLGVVCSALAFVIFFALIEQIGSARATLITYLNTAVAIVLGILFLAEPLTTGILIGFPMVLIGSYFASKKHAVKALDAAL